MRICYLATAALLLCSTTLPAQRLSEYCRGFEEGWKSLSGAISPVCPVEPVTPVGSTPFREGVKDGMGAARKSRPAPLMSSNRENAGTFCEGFEEGYRAIKGDLAIVPVCPVAPVTPIGSTDYREGLKAGMARARRQD